MWYIRRHGMAEIGNQNETDSSKTPSEVAASGIDASRESLMRALAVSIVLLFVLIIVAGLVLILS
jgi:hypothetical protein